jgi:hypothetical protein
MKVLAAEPEQNECGDGESATTVHCLADSGTRSSLR